MQKKFFLFIIFFLTSCGVKGPPSPPPGTVVPSLMDYHLNKLIEEKKNQDKNNKKKS